MQKRPLDSWDTSLQTVIDDMGGQPLNIHSMLANHPPLLAAWWPLRQYLVNGGALHRRECELAILRIAARRGNWYEWGSHVVRGLDNGLTQAEIDRVLAGGDEWAAGDAALLAAIDELECHNVLDAAIRQQLAPHYSEQQVLDLIFLHGMYRTLDSVIGSWGLDLDAHVADRLPEGTTEATFCKTVT